MLKAPTNFLFFGLGSVLSIVLLVSRVICQIKCFPSGDMQVQCFRLDYAPRIVFQVRFCVGIVL